MEKYKSISSIQMNQNVSGLEAISSFSAIRMFGHLFDLHPGLEKRIQCVEDIAQELLRQQLAMHLPIVVSQSIKEVMQKTELVQQLSVLFSPESTFWENYYARQHCASDANIERIDLFEASPDEIHQIARHRYPIFYTVLDALYYSKTIRHHEYSLIQLSMQAFLECLLLRHCGYETESDAMLAKAIQLMGPIHAPQYVHYLQVALV
jgi:hypothetical protein